MPVIGAKLVAMNIKAYGGGFLKKVNKEMRYVKRLMNKEVTKNISLTGEEGLTLRELRVLDHPYARRHGEMGKSSSLPNPYWLVHKRSGKLLKSKKSGVVDASMTLGKLEASAYVGLDADVAKHANHVIYGTSKMIPRPVLTESRDNVIPEAVKHLKDTLTYLTLNFRGK